MNQMEYFEILVRERRDPDNVNNALAWAQTASTQEISAQIDRLKAEPKIALPAPEKGFPTPPSEIEIGMYRKHDGRMFRVYPARSGGHLLCKELVPDSEVGWSTNCGWHFEYRGAAHRFVVAAERMTLEEAKAWGADFGTCCVCAALLTDPTSVANGIGPICGSRV